MTAVVTSGSRGGLCVPSRIKAIMPLGMANPKSENADAVSIFSWENSCASCVVVMASRAPFIFFL